MSESLVVPDYAAPSSTAPQPNEPANGPPPEKESDGPGMPVKPEVRVLGLRINAAGAVLVLVVLVMVLAMSGGSDDAPGGGGAAAAAGPAVTVGRFAAVPSVMSQIDAQLYCEANYPAGGGLASIHTIAEHAAAVSACRALGPSTTWRGADEAGMPDAVRLST